MKILKDFKVSKKRVFLRSDFNVPLDEKGNILDDFRIKMVIPTIEYLIEKKAKVILASHLGRPEGKMIESLKLDPIQEKLIEYLDLSVTKAPDCVGKEIEDWTKKMQPGEILLLENLRFHKEEEENDPDFAQALANLSDLYINEAFSASHRAHASIVGVPKYLPSGAGFLLEKEIKVLTDLMENPKKPLLAIIGGKKVETKTGVIDKISEKADWVLIGGLIKKEIEEKNIQLKYPQKILAPLDSLDDKDLGPKTIELFREKILESKTIFWNGPLGKIEEKEFSKGTREIAQAIIKSSAFSIVGGGETIEFLNQIGLAEKFNHLSTGGGAMLEFLAGKILPGLKALNFYAGN